MPPGTLNQDEVNAAYREAGITVNIDGVVPIDELKDVYKSPREVVDAVTQAGMATIEHELLPLASIKRYDYQGDNETFCDWDKRPPSLTVMLMVDSVL